jgi:hypothetical protein
MLKGKERNASKKEGGEITTHWQLRAWWLSVFGKNKLVAKKSHPRVNFLGHIVYSNEWVFHRRRSN